MAANNPLWALYQEIMYNWQGYIIVVAKNNGIDPNDLLDAVLNHCVEYKVSNVKSVIIDKMYELKHRKEVPLSKINTEDDIRDDNILDKLMFEMQNKHKEPKTSTKLDGLPSDLRDYLVSRVRIEKLLPIKERLEFRKKLKEAEKYLGGNTE